MNKKIICSSCGGEFEDTLPKCPYCSSLNYKGAELEYLEKLEDVRSDVEELGAVPEREVKKELRKQGRFVLKVLLVVAAILAVFVGLYIWDELKYARDPQADYAWKQENYPIMNELYAQGKYEELVAFRKEAYTQNAPLYEWEHREFCDIMEVVLELEDIWKREAAGEPLVDSDYMSLLYREWNLTGEDWKGNLSEEEIEILLPMIRTVQEDFEGRWEFTEEQRAEFEEARRENYGIVPYKLCDKYVEQWLKEMKQ